MNRIKFFVSADACSMIRGTVGEFEVCQSRNSCNKRVHLLSRQVLTHMYDVAKHVATMWDTDFENGKMWSKHKQAVSPQQNKV